MFLNNAPLENSGSFPNKLLAVRLSSLLTERPLQAKEVARAFFEDPAMTTPEGLQQLPLRMQAYARGLNDERLNQLRIGTAGPGQRGGESIFRGSCNDNPRGASTTAVADAGVCPRAERRAA